MGDKSTTESAQEKQIIVFGEFLRDHVPALLPALGSVILAVGTALASGAKVPLFGWTQSSTQLIILAWTLVVVGAVLIVWGTVLNTKRKTLLSNLTDDLNDCKDALDRANNAKRLFLIMPAKDDPWQFELERAIMKQVNDNNYDLSSKAPDVNFTTAEQENAFRTILERRDDYAGGFVIIFDPENIRSHLLTFAKDFAKPIVLLDQPPFAQQEDYLRTTAFVGVSNNAGGGLAVTAALTINVTRTKSYSVCSLLPAMHKKRDTPPSETLSRRLLEALARSSKR